MSVQQPPQEAPAVTEPDLQQHDPIVPQVPETPAAEPADAEPEADVPVNPTDQIVWNRPGARIINAADWQKLGSGSGLSIWPGPGYHLPASDFDSAAISFFRTQAPYFTIVPGDAE